MRFFREVRTIIVVKYISRTGHLTIMVSSNNETGGRIDVASIEFSEGLTIIIVLCEFTVICTNGFNFIRKYVYEDKVSLHIIFLEEWRRNRIDNIHSKYL